MQACAAHAHTHTNVKPLHPHPIGLCLCSHVCVVRLRPARATATGRSVGRSAVGGLRLLSLRCASRSRAAARRRGGRGRPGGIGGLVEEEAGGWRARHARRLIVRLRHARRRLGKLVRELVQACALLRVGDGWRRLRGLDRQRAELRLYRHRRAAREVELPPATRAARAWRFRGTRTRRVGGAGSQAHVPQLTTAPCTPSMAVAAAAKSSGSAPCSGVR